MAAHIADAIRTLEDLMLNLDGAYWEASTLDRKDRFYDLISSVHRELSELSKLSVQDHGLEYEPITSEFKVARGQLSLLRKRLDECVLRSETAGKLETSITDAVSLSEP